MKFFGFISGSILLLLYKHFSLTDFLPITTGSQVNNYSKSSNYGIWLANHKIFL